VRRFGRALAGLLSIVVLLAAVYGAVMAVRWVDSETGFGLLDRRPEQPLAFSSLNGYTEEAAARPSFRRYFTTMVVPEQDVGTTEAPVVTKWERPRVVIKLLNSGGPGIEGYLRQLVRRLNRMQAEVRFAVGDTAPRITIRFLTHTAYARAIGDDSVGSTRTQYFRTSPGLIRASIAVDTGRQDTPGQLKATLIHELTHAIGCGGHFSSLSDRRRSVLYESSQITAWSQNDAAVIRLLYSPWIESGMTAAQAQASLRRYARSVD
jgi:Protein of unknown function (DUF2927)